MKKNGKTPDPFAYMDEEERDLMESFERGEWQTIPEHERSAMMAMLQQAARNTLRKDKRINIRLNQLDLNAIKARAQAEGMPYQTLIASVMHKYVTGALKPV